MRTISPSSEGYTMELDCVDESGWHDLLRKFSDASIYQTWPYADVVSGSANVHRLILKHRGNVVAMAQVRIAKLPVLSFGIAYVQWGPVWQLTGAAVDPEILRQAIRALRNEFVCRRGLTLRLFPRLHSGDSTTLSTVLKEEGFQGLAEETKNTTILMDLRPSVDDLHSGMRAHWKRELKTGEKKPSEIIEGTGDDLFASFIGIYKEMVARKKFVEPNDIEQFRAIQKRLPESLRMKIMLCRSGESVHSGLISSAIGDTAVYLFGATSNAGNKSRGSYLLQWKLLQGLKRDGVLTYDLNGVNLLKNPGTYKFKDDLAGTNGTEVAFLGRFESYGSSLGRTCIQYADRARTTYRKLKAWKKADRTTQLQPLPAQSDAKPHTQELANRPMTASLPQNQL